MYNFISKSLYKFFCTFNKLKLENENILSEHDSYILAGNHTSNLDPLVLIALSHDKKPFHFMAKDSIFKNKFIAKFLGKMNAFPVSRGKTDLSAIKTATKILKNDNILGIFPEGTRNKEFGKLKNGFTIFSLKNEKPIIPICIKYKKRFIFNEIKVVVLEPIFPPKYSKENTEIDMENLKKEFVKRMNDELSNY